MLKPLFRFNRRLLAIWGIILTIFLPLYPKFPLFFLSGQKVAIRLDDLLVFFGFLVFLLAELETKFSTLKKPFIRLVALFLGAYTLATLNGIFLGHDLNANTGLLHLLRRFQYFSVFLLISKSLESTRHIRDYLWAGVLALLGITIYGLGQKFFFWPIISTMNEEFAKGILLTVTSFTRVSSTFAGHYDLAAFLSLFLPLLLIFSLSFKKLYLKLPLLLLWTCSFYLLILTASRVSFATHFIAGIAVLLFAKKFLWLFPFLALNVIAMFISPELNQRLVASFHYDLVRQLDQIAWLKPKPPTSTPLPTLVPLIPTIAPIVQNTRPSQPTPTPQKKKATSSAEFVWPQESITESAYRSSSVRYEVEWPRAWRALKKNPLLGTGPGSLTLATDNDFLRALGEAGLLGFLAWVLPIFFLFTQTIASISKKHPQRPLLVAFSFLIITMFLNATLIDVFEASKVAYFFWISMALLLALIEKPETY